MVDLFDGVRILPCKVFDTKLATSVQQVITAIHWASDNGAEIICLCLSTPHDRFVPALYAACAYARGRGTWLIAAASNRHEASFPAQFDTVVGVESVAAKSPAVLYARTRHAFRFVAAGNRGEQKETFNSYAAARVAGWEPYCWRRPLAEGATTSKHTWYDMRRSSTLSTSGKVP